MNSFLLWGAALCVFLNAGCADTNSSLFGGNLPSRPVETPNLPEAAVVVAARVDQVGRELLAANPFLGIDPVFHTVAITEPVLFHPDLNGIFISEGLVKRCETDDALATVLAAELGQMSAERKTANRSELPPLPVNLPDGSNQNAGGITSDQTHLAELANYEKKYRRVGSGIIDARATTQEILRSAGRPDSQLAAMEPLIKNARANQVQLGSLAPRSTAPHWTP